MKLTFIGCCSMCCIAEKSTGTRERGSTTSTLVTGTIGIRIFSWFCNEDTSQVLAGCFGHFPRTLRELQEWDIKFHPLEWTEKDVH